MDGKETAKRKQVLEGNAFYEIDLECMRKKEKREKEESPETEEELFTRLWVLRESYVKKTGEGLGTSLEGLDFSGISGYRISGYKGKKNGKALKESFFEWEYDGYRIAVCEEKDCEPEFVVCSRTIDNCFL